MRLTVYLKRRLEMIHTITEAIMVAQEHNLPKELDDHFEYLTDGETLDSVLVALGWVAIDTLKGDLTNVINASESDNLSPVEEERLDELYADITGVKEHLTELCEWFEGLSTRPKS